MKLIIGLGNPEENYAGTRHNIGFEIIDKLKGDWDFPDFEFNKKFDSAISKKKLEIGNWKLEILLVKPQTFVNLSGEAVQKILEFYKLTPNDIIVIHDDLDIMLGKFKIATDSSSAGHNGVQNIIDKLSTQKFKRVRIGIGEEQSGAPICPPRVAERPPRVEAGRVDAHDYVLGKFSDEELGKMKKISGNILDAIKKLL